ncbi:MAG: hypothetical protein PVJ05_06775 [Candidatus Thorarchaeota archaeon]|jgi:hypothetical protein
MTVAKGNEKVAKEEDLDQTPSTKENKKYDISDALEVTGHFTTRYSNGLTLGVRLEAIPETRGVHVDVVYVLDLRVAEFGSSGLAMRAAVLESINRSLPRVMGDVGLDEFMSEVAVLTPWGRIYLSLLRGSSGRTESLIHETRTVYVINEGTKPTMDLTWLTDTGRVVTPEEFILARRSDARSTLPNLKKSILASKWTLLESGFTKGWFGVLALAGLIIGMATSFSVLTVDSGSLIIPLLVSALSGLVGGWLLQSSRNSINGFVTSLSEEQKILARLGDSDRISQSIIENEDKLILIGDLNFVVSPLIAASGRALEEGDVDAAVSAACSVLDECVRLAPLESNSNSAVMISADVGLRKFLGLFEDLGGVEEEEALALAYVGFTGHVTKVVTFTEAVEHLTQLNNALYHIGALRPDIKDSIDDHLNQRAMKETVEAIDKEIVSDEAEISTPTKKKDPSEVKEDEPDTKEVSEDDEEIFEEILHASVDTSSNTEDGIESDEPEMKITGADVVIGETRKKKKRVKETKQLSLLDEIELAESTGVSEEERGSASV